MAAPRTFDDPLLGRVTATRGSLIRPGRKPFVVVSDVAGRFAVEAHDRARTPLGEAELAPGEGHFRRRQYDGHLRLDGMGWRLRQTGWFTASADRDGTPLARLRAHRCGWLTPRRSADWTVEAWTPDADGFDGGVVCLLALWAGVGAQGCLADLTPEPLLAPVYLVRQRREALP